jgi:hypothetical protein
MPPEIARCPYVYRHESHEYVDRYRVAMLCPGVRPTGRPVETVKLAEPCSFYGVEGCSCLYCEPG